MQDVSWAVWITAVELQVILRFESGFAVLAIYSCSMPAAFIPEKNTYQRETSVTEKQKILYVF